MDIKLNDIQNNMMTDSKSSHTSTNISNGTIGKTHGFVEGSASFSKDTITNSKYGSAAYKNGASIKDVQNAIGAIDVKTSTDYMTLMANTVSDKDLGKVMEEGYEPGDMEPGDIVTIVDKIKATLAQAGTVISGYNDDLDVDTIREVAGSEAYAYDIASAFNKYDVPATKENVADMVNSIEAASTLAVMSDSAIRYMVDNELNPTIGNVYMAQHSSSQMVQSSQYQTRGYFSDGSGYLGKKAEAGEGQLADSLKAQLEDVIEKSGYEINDKTLSDARYMVEQGMQITEDSFALFEELKEIELPVDMAKIMDRAAMSIKEGMGAKDASLTDGDSLMDKAVSLVQDVNNIDDEALKNIVDSGRKLNIRNLVAESKKLTKPSDEEMTRELTDNKSYSKAYTLLQETRLSMTVSSTYVLLKNNINVDVRDLSLLVDELKEAENRQFELIYGKDKTAEIEELAEVTKDRIDSIKNSPVEVIGLVATRTSYNLNIVYEEGQALKGAFEQASRKYEPLMTEVRADLGDNIQKAFTNVDDILEEMNMDITKDNERAVKILGYNNMEITDENISKINDTYHEVKNVIDKMTPGKVIELIREGINPLEISMEDLEKRLGRDELSDHIEAERYSNYLVRMEAKGEITPEERDSYIGIYRMIHQIERNDGAAIGTLINSRGEINFKNLLSAVRTRRDKGMDFKVDDSFGEIKSISRSEISIDEQIARAFSINQTDEEIAPSSILKDAGNVEEFVGTLLNSLDVPGTVNNLVATKQLLTNSDNIFHTIKELSDKSTKKYGNVDKNVDNAKENVINEAMDKIDNLITDVTESFEDKDSVQNVFEQLSGAADDLLKNLKEGADNSIDVRSIAACYKQINVSRAMAKNEYYQVPVKIGEDYTSVSVRIIHGSSNSGSVSVHLEHEAFGNVSADLRVNSEGNFEGYITGESDSQVALLEERADRFNESLSFIEGRKNINYIKSSSGLKQFVESTDKLSKEASKGIEETESKDAISTRTLYRVAKSFIKVFAE